jgi:hypothetical protein
MTFNPITDLLELIVMGAAGVCPDKPLTGSNPTHGLPCEAVIGNVDRSG